MGASYAVRCGGSNSGHTVVDDSGKIWIFRHLPTAAILPEVKLAICAGSYIDVDVLLEEIEEVGITPDRLTIDPEAVIISQECKDFERDSGLVHSIGSTGSGTGAAVANRILRKTSVKFAKSHKALVPFIANVSAVLRAELDRKARVILEGTQGFGLSPLHSGFFPKVTSRETTAAAFISEVGLSPFDVDDIALVVRAFPIRVSGNSGPLKNEISWEIITKEGGHSSSILEYTTVSRKVRRVGRFDPYTVLKAISVNQPTKIFMNHMDYISDGITESDDLLIEFINNMERMINRGIDYIGLSPSCVKKAIY